MEARWLSYDPTGGHTDQLRSVSLAIAIAQRLGRRVVLPPYLHHRDVTVQSARRKLPSLIFHGRRPWLSSVIRLSTSVPVIDGGANASRLGLPLPRHLLRAPISLVAHELPRCGKDGRLRRGRAASPPEGSVCLHWAEPPEAYASVGSALQRLVQLKHVPWIHFSSMLDVLSARQKHRHPLATWEEQMRPSRCILRYRRAAMDAAREALRSSRPAMPGVASGEFAAAHVRALARDKYKAESAEEYIPRLRRLVLKAGRRFAARGSPSVALYIATDDPTTVLPLASRELARLNVTILSRLSCDASAVGGIHPDSEVAQMVLDLAAMLTASDFSAAPRSGLSVHVSSLRGCDREGRPCDPAAASCVRYASSGCGGVFPESLLHAAAVRTREHRYRCAPSPMHT